jgi:hypothetical protein
MMSLGRATSPVASVDPATLSLTGFWRPDGVEYNGSPWPGTASAGSSASNPLTEATNPPSVGAALNTYTGADFDGTNDVLSAAAFATLFTDAAGSAWCLFNADAATADPGAGTFYTAPGFLSDSANRWTFGFTSAGVILGSYNGTNFDRIAVTCGTAGWHLAQARWGSGVLEARVDSGGWSTLSRTIVSSGGVLRMGTNYNATTFYNGRVQECGTANTRLADATFDGIKANINTRYGLSL